MNSNKKQKQNKKRKIDDSLTTASIQQEMLPIRKPVAEIASSQAQVQQ